MARRKLQEKDHLHIDNEEEQTLIHVWAYVQMQTISSYLYK